MSYGGSNSYGSYNYQTEGRRNSNSFSGEANGRVKRRKFPSRKRFGSNDMDSSTTFNSQSHNAFKEPLPPSRSPGGLRDNAIRSPAREYLDKMKGTQFVEPQHAGSTWSREVFDRECKAWQDKHKLAYYKSRCMALEFENQMLFQQISSLIDENGFLAAERGVKTSPLVSNLLGKAEKQPAQDSSPIKKQGKTRQNKPTTTPSQTSGSGVEFEVCEEMMAYLEKSMRHKLSLKKGKQPQKEKTQDNKGKGKEKKEGPKQPMGQKRQEELELFYGKNANQIQGLETAVQLNFNRSCDTHRPKLWMAAPLNPNTVDEGSDD